MPNDCWNNITITCKNSDELDKLMQNELLHKKDNGEMLRMIIKGKYGIIFHIWSAWKPDFIWLENLLTKYPNCWIKNEWSEEGGLAGVWIGYIDAVIKTMNIQNMEWNDLSIEEKHYLFMEEDYKTL